MESAELRELLTQEALVLLDSLEPSTSTDDVVRLVGRLRRDGHPATRVAAVLSQYRLRRRASAKFGQFADRMLFTETGLEQATRLRVAALHAGRFAAAGLEHVADLGCGIGGDAMAMAALDLRVTAVERDEVTAALAFSPTTRSDAAMLSRLQRKMHQDVGEAQRDRRHRAECLALTTRLA